MKARDLSDMHGRLTAGNMAKSIRASPVRAIMACAIDEVPSHGDDFHYFASYQVLATQGAEDIWPRLQQQLKVVQSAHRDDGY